MDKGKRVSRSNRFICILLVAPSGGSAGYANDPKGDRCPLTAHVRIDIAGGIAISSSITNEAVDELALKPGDDAWAVIKASDVMIGK